MDRYLLRKLDVCLVPKVEIYFEIFEIMSERNVTDVKVEDSHELKSLENEINKRYAKAQACGHIS